MKINYGKSKYFFRFISPLKGSENQLSKYESIFTSPSGEERQKEILDSIHYAKRIQTALMPHEKLINKNLNRLKK